MARSLMVAGRMGSVSGRLTLAVVSNRSLTVAARMARSLTLAVLIPWLLLLSASCTYGGGELLYNLGVGKKKAIPAEFRLTDGRLMVFIDDVHENVDWPPARAYLFDDLTQDLLRNNAARKIIPLETIDARRGATPDFDKLSCRQVGELFDADQVLWVEMKDFMAEEDFAETGEAALWTVSVRVIDPKQKESRGLVRLWPGSPAGRIVTATLGAADVIQLKTKDAISKKLSTELAAEVSRLFYDYTPGDTER